MFQTWVESLNLWGLNFALKILLQLCFVLYGSVVTRCSTGITLYSVGIPLVFWSVPQVFRAMFSCFAFVPGRSAVPPVFRVPAVYMVLYYAVANVKVKTDTKAWLKLRENRNYMKWKSNWNYLIATLHETTWNIWFENINQTKSTSLLTFIKLS